MDLSACRVLRLSWRSSFLVCVASGVIVLRAISLLPSRSIDVYLNRLVACCLSLQLDALVVTVR